MALAWWLRTIVAVARRPSLWAVACVQVVRLARKRWWRRPPFLPIPDREYLAFRLETMYGSRSRDPDVSDVVTYLRWCRDFPG